MTDNIWLLMAVRTPKRVFSFIRLTPYHTAKHTNGTIWNEEVSELNAYEHAMVTKRQAVTHAGKHR